MQYPNGTNGNGNHPQPFRPAQHTQQQLITAILDGAYPPGSPLPAERRLAELFGVTRPTIREALQRLASEGWVTIRHGKATEVNNFWETGGLGLLGTLARYGGQLPDRLVVHLLEFRVIMLPPVARRAAAEHSADIQAYLARRHDLDDMAEAYTAYDWDLQVLLARRSGNPLFPMILNDFKTVFHTMGQFYFTHSAGRNASAAYYGALERAIGDSGETVESVVKMAMETGITIWRQINSATKENTDGAMERLGG